MSSRQPKPIMLGKPAAAPDEDDDPRDAITQRVVPASAAGKPQSTGVASVFAMAAQAGTLAKAEAKAQAAAQPKDRKRAVKHLLDPEAVPIKQGVPLPITKGGRGSEARYAALAQRMGIGDCVELTERHGKTLASEARKRGMKMATRRLPNGQLGVWRLS